MLMAAGALLMAACDSEDTPVLDSGEAPHGDVCPAPASVPAGASAPPLLEDVTAQAGTDFVHDKHETGEFRVPEINGAGVGVLDYDNDGFYDLYFVQGGQLPGVEGGHLLSDQLYRNRGDGTFENVTIRAGINATGFGMGVVCGDYDNDGDVDVFVYNTGPDTLLRNNGDGTFTDVTAEANLGDPRWGDGAAFLDYDADGWLDLFVCNYFVWDPADEKKCTIRDIAQRDYCGPAVYKGDRDILYHNNGDGTFTDLSVEVGIGELIGTGMGVGVCDFNCDGLQDIYVGNDARSNRMLIQRPDHTFVDRAPELLCDLNEEGTAQSSMGITIEDFNLDGRFDLLLGHFWDDPCTIYLNRGDMFHDMSRRTRLHIATRRFTTWAISVLDLYNDGRMQLYFGNGKVNKANKVIYNPGDPYAERDLLLEWSYQSQQFTDITEQAGPVFDVAYVTRGSAVIDYDNDGDMDLALAHNGGPGRLLRNNSPVGHHSLAVRCIGPDGKRDAYGAIVEIEAGGKTRCRQVFVACSYCSSCDPRVHFGLGETSHVDRLTVHWLDGRWSTWLEVPADQVFVARYGDRSALVASSR